MIERNIGQEREKRLDLNKMLGNIEKAPIHLQAAIFDRVITKL